MAYIGSTPTTQNFIAGTDTFSGTGSQTIFALSRPVNTVNDILVVVNNVDQQPSAYTVSGSSLTLSAAPSSGTNNVYVRYLSTTLLSLGGGASTPAAVSDQPNTSTGYFGLPSGTTAERPASPSAGYIRFNTTIEYPEYYDGSAWWQVNQTRSFNADYLVIAGGGAGGGYVSGGGGAGGVVQGTITLIPGNTYTAVIGAGGAYPLTNAPGAQGSNTTFTGVTTAVGGGGGATGGGGVGLATSGGSGGGGGSTTAALAGAAGTAGQGFAGGTAPGQTGNYPSGGGGGSAAVGGSPANTSAIGGAGGAGISSSITGSATNYAGGGGGATGNSLAGGVGGVGGGGNGGSFTGAGVYISGSTSGTANTGGGGGGGRGNGGSGVVILSLPTAVYTGVVTGSPTVTTFGVNTIIKFTASGSYTA
jgi:hypothetical protein